MYKHLLHWYWSCIDTCSSISYRDYKRKVATPHAHIASYTDLLWYLAHREWFKYCRMSCYVHGMSRYCPACAVQAHSTANHGVDSYVYGRCQERSSQCQLRSFFSQPRQLPCGVSWPPSFVFASTKPTFKTDCLKSCRQRRIMRCCWLRPLQ